MSFYNMCLVLAIFLTQLFVIESYAKETNNIKLVTLTAKEIQALPAQKRIEYIKELRELVEASEKTQNAFYGAELYANSNKLINQFLQYALISEAWAVDVTPSLNTCIIAGNVGVLRGGRCGFTDEQKARNAACGNDKVACNPSLYGDNVCVPKSDMANATANCNGKDTDFASVLAKYKGDVIGMDDTDLALRKIAEEADNIFGHCIKARKSGKITRDQDKTCRKLEERIAKIGTKACDIAGVDHKQGSSNGSDQQLAARIKSCEETAKKIAKDFCESKAAQFDNDAENLNIACSTNGFKTGQLVSPACYPELEKCKKNGYSDKCFSSNEALSEEQIKDDVAKIKDNFKIKTNNAINSIMSSCFPSTEPKFSGRSADAQAFVDDTNAYKKYKEFLELETTYNSESDRTLQSGLRSAKGNVEDQRKHWQVYLGSVNAGNERAISAIEERVKKCNIDENVKKDVLNKMRDLRSYNDEIANKFRHNENLVAKTKYKEPGIVDTNDQLIKNKREIKKWFDSNDKSGTFKACCESPRNGEKPYLLKNKWCDKSGSGIAARVYGLPLSPEQASGEAYTDFESPSESGGGGVSVGN